MDAHCLRRFIDGEPLVMMKQHRLPFLNRQGQHVKIQIVILFGHGPRGKQPIIRLYTPYPCRASPGAFSMCRQTFRNVS